MEDLGGLPWWFGGYDFELQMQGVWVQSLVGELRSHMPPDMAKKNKKYLEELYNSGIFSKWF